MPTIKKPNQHFDATLYTGTGSAQTITNAGGFQPDFVWIKRRNGSPSDNHVLQDSVRGLDKFLISNSTAAEASQGDSDGVTSYNTNGFTLGYTNSDAWNSNTNTYVGWQWKAGGASTVNTSGSISSNVSVNTTAGFSIVTYTGNGTAGATVGHGLGVAPVFVIWKNRSVAGTAWLVQGNNIGNPTDGWLLTLHTTNQRFQSTDNNNTFGSTTITLDYADSQNGNGNSMVAYCFAEVEGYSKFGSYTGNGSADGPFVYLGFRPRFVMIKRTDGGTANWYLLDSARSPYNLSANMLFPNLSAGETSTAEDNKDFLSNGFKVRTSNQESNISGGTYIYMAFAEAPFKFSNAR